MKKTILITGSTDGIGKLAAIKLAKDGHEIYLHGRNGAKLTSVIAEVKDRSQNEKIAGFTADFSDLASVKNLATEVAQALDKIDVLINNAGVFKSPTTLTDAGLDLRMTVNYLAPYLLTKELIPLLAKSHSPRLINLSSAAQAPVSEAVLLGKEISSEQETYAQSKLALTMWSLHLAKTHPHISVIAVNPGSLLNTNMVREAYGRHWAPADKGADILYYLAVAKKYEGITGKYFDNDMGDFGRIHPAGQNESTIDSLIANTNELLGLQSID